MNIPIFPLNTVLFPDGLLPLRIFEARYMDMARACLKTKDPFGVCLIKEGKEVGAPAVPEPIGTLATIQEFDMPQLGLLHVVSRGGARFRILAHAAGAQSLIRADVELIPSEAAHPVPPEFHACTQLLQRIVADRGPAVFSNPQRMDDASWVGCRLAEILPIPNTAKQKLLELDDGLARLEILHRFLEERGLLGAK